MTAVPILYLDLVNGVYWVNGSYYTFAEIFTPAVYNANVSTISVSAAGARLTNYPNDIHTPFFGIGCKSLASSVFSALYNAGTTLTCVGRYSMDATTVAEDQGDVPFFMWDIDAGAPFPATNFLSVYSARSFRFPLTGTPEVYGFNGENNINRIDSPVTFAATANEVIGMSWLLQSGLQSEFAVQGIDHVILPPPDVKLYSAGPMFWFRTSGVFGQPGSSYLRFFAIYINAPDVVPLSNPAIAPPPPPTPPGPLRLTLPMPVPTPLPCVPCCSTAAPVIPWALRL